MSETKEQTIIKNFVNTSIHYVDSLWIENKRTTINIDELINNFLTIIKCEAILN